MKIKKSIQANRFGLSVIEVLTSILIALIGVAGVMIMIPFAVGQAEIGFDQETAYRMGANLADEFDIKGFSDSNRWTIGPSQRTSRSYVIDPIWTSQWSLPSEAVFPFVAPTLQGLGLPGSADQSIFVQRTNLFGAVAPLAPMSLGLARHHFTWSDDLQTQELTKVEATTAGYVNVDLAPPKQLFDVDGSGANMRRQSLGEMSSMVITSPVSISPSPLTYPATPDTGNSDYAAEFRNVVVVYKTRPTPLVSAAGRAPYDRMYQVDANFTINSSTEWSYKMAFSGGTIAIIAPAGTSIGDSNNLSIQRAEIRRGDWMALTNVKFDPNSQRYSQQINFYQVLDSFPVFDGAGNILSSTISLQGPDFDFGWILENSGTGWQPRSGQTYAQFNDFIASVTAGATTTLIPSKTYAIHLPDVWAVFERTYR